MVDEAQDTSPLQWQVIAKLAQEITSGEGARSGEKRTLFVVGDKKQSIYSFQGADADAFDDMKNAFGDQLAHTLTPLYDRSLEYSFDRHRPFCRWLTKPLQEKIHPVFHCLNSI